MHDIGRIGWQIAELLSPLIIVAVGWIAAKIVAWVNARTQNEKTGGLLDRLGDVVVGVVKDLEQTVVKELKTSGRLDKLTAERIKSQAVAAVKSHYGQRGLDELGYVLGFDEKQLDRYLSSHIEAAVFDVNRLPRPLAVGYPAR